MRDSRLYQCMGTDHCAKTATKLHTIVWLFTRMLPFKGSSVRIRTFLFRPEHRFHHPLFLFYWIATPVNTMLDAFEDNWNEFGHRKIAHVKSKVRFVYGAILTSRFLQQLFTTLPEDRLKKLDHLHTYIASSRANFENNTTALPRYFHVAEELQGLIICYTADAVKRIREDKLNRFISKPKDRKPVDNNGVFKKEILKVFGPRLNYILPMDNFRNYITHIRYGEPVSMEEVPNGDSQLHDYDHLFSEENNTDVQNEDEKRHEIEKDGTDKDNNDEIDEMEKDGTDEDSKDEMEKDETDKDNNNDNDKVNGNNDEMEKIATDKDKIDGNKDEMEEDETHKDDNDTIDTNGNKKKMDVTTKDSTLNNNKMDNDITVHNNDIENQEEKPDEMEKQGSIPTRKGQRKRKAAEAYEPQMTKYSISRKSSKTTARTNVAKKVDDDRLQKASDEFYRNVNNVLAVVKRKKLPDHQFEGLHNNFSSIWLHSTQFCQLLDQNNWPKK